MLCVTAVSAAQGRYFVDGYHGGVYGHYPLKWKTKFILDNLAKHPEWRVSLEIEPETWDSVKVVTPRAYAEFARKVGSEQMEFTNPSYAQPYCYNISGESIIRQFQYGIAKIRSHFPNATFVTYSVEEPCFTSCLPMILSGLGIKYASLKCPNTCWGGYTAAHGGELVNWIGPDGSRLLAVPRYGCESLKPGSTWQTIAWTNSDRYFEACSAYGINNPVGMCLQDAGWRNGPWIKDGGGTKYVLWSHYIENIADPSAATDYHFSQEDVRVNLMWGSQVMQRIGRQVRSAENAIVKAEKMSVIGHLDHGYCADQAAIDEAWRTLMLSQHHDSWIVPYNGLKNYGTWADAIKQWTDVTLATAQAVTLGSMPTSATGNAVRVVNTQGIARTEVVKVSLAGRLANKTVRLYDNRGAKVESAVHGEELYFEATVPPFGYATYKMEFIDGVVSETSVREMRGGEYTIENDVYSITFDLDRGGVAKSIVAKHCGGKEYVDAGSEYLFGEMRGYFYNKGRFVSSREREATLKVLIDNALVKQVQIEGYIAEHPYTKVITITKGSELIDVNLTIDWQHNEGIGEYRESKWVADRRAYCDDRYKLSVMFPAALAETRIYKNAPYDVCKSSAENTFFNRWSEIKHNVILHWVDEAEERGNYAMALYSDHTTSYQHGSDYPLALTLQYSGQGLWGRNYLIDRSTQVKYSLMPHTGTWQKAKVSEKSDCINEPLQAIIIDDDKLLSKSYVKLPEGVMVSAANVVDNSLVIRLYNASGIAGKKRVTLGIAAKSLTEIDLLGNEVTEIRAKTKQPDKTTFDVELPQYGIKTIKITI